VGSDGSRHEHEDGPHAPAWPWLLRSPPVSRLDRVLSDVARWQEGVGVVLGEGPVVRGGLLLQHSGEACESNAVSGERCPRLAQRARERERERAARGRR
jgi:hypothetical protein